jgi:hypothetical protein
MRTWQRIRDREALETVNTSGNIVVGWWVDMPGVGHWWEVSDDWLTDCATHWCETPEPPCFEAPRDSGSGPEGGDGTAPGEAPQSGLRASEGIAQPTAPPPKPRNP